MGFFLRMSILLVLTACSTAMMSSSSFENIPVGSPIVQVEREYGTPYDMALLGGDVVEYRYIQRIRVGPNSNEQIHYIFRVCNGKIISKQIKEYQGPLDLNTP